MPCKPFAEFYFLNLQRIISGWADLNRRPHAPQTCTLTNCATARRIKLQVVESIMGFRPMSTTLPVPAPPHGGLSRSGETGPYTGSPDPPRRRGMNSGNSYSMRPFSRTCIMA
jgi:hypothetical protein